MKDRRKSGVRLRKLDKAKGEVAILVFKYYKGFSYINEIITHPNVQIPNVLLAAERCSLREFPGHLMQDGFSTEESLYRQQFQIAYYEPGIELTDLRTISDCFERLNQLNQKIAVIKTLEKRDDRQLGLLEDEVRDILKYLRETYDFDKKMVKRTRTAMNRIYQRLYTAVWRAIKLVEEEDEATATLLRMTVKVKAYYSIYKPDEDVEILIEKE